MDRWVGMTQSGKQRINSKNNLLSLDIHANKLFAIERLGRRSSQDVAVTTVQVHLHDAFNVNLSLGNGVATELGLTAHSARGTAVVSTFVKRQAKDSY